MSEKGLFWRHGIEYITQRSITGLLYTLYKGHLCFPFLTLQMFSCIIKELSQITKEIQAQILRTQMSTLRNTYGLYLK